MIQKDTSMSRKLSIGEGNDRGGRKMEWRPDLLGGVMAMTGKWQDGTPMLAVPNYARMNRAMELNDQTAGGASINYAPGSTAGAGSNPAAAGNLRRIRTRAIQSKVWMTDRI